MGDVPFNLTPSNLRAPLFYAELDPSKANTAAAAQRTMLVGQITGAGTWTPNVPVRVISPTAAITGAGAGSILAAMAAIYLLNDPTAEVWALPVADAVGATAAAGSITVTGPATAAGTISLYVAGVLVQIPVNVGDAASTIAANIAADINASTGQVITTMAACGLPVTATAAAGVVTLTARNAGLAGNDIDVRLNFLGTAGDQALPTGVGATIVAMSGGATNPVLTTALSNLASAAYDFIVLSATDTATLNGVQAFLSDANGRWNPLQQIYGHAWAALRGTAGTLATAGLARNDQHLSIVGFYDSPSPEWAWAAAFAGTAALSLRNDPAQPLHTLVVQGVLAPQQQSQFSLPVRNTTLLYSGISTFTVSTSGVVAIESIITTYTTNLQGAPDNSYLQVETMYNLMYVIRAMRTMVQTKYARVKLAADGVRLPPGSNVVTPSTIRGDLIATFRGLCTAGYCQNPDAFAANVIVEQDSTNPNRVNVLWPGTLIDQLDVFAMLVQFRLM